MSLQGSASLATLNNAPSSPYFPYIFYQSARLQSVVTRRDRVSLFPFRQLCITAQRTPARHLIASPRVSIQNDRHTYGRILSTDSPNTSLRTHNLHESDPIPTSTLHLSHKTTHQHCGRFEGHIHPWHGPAQGTYPDKRKTQALKDTTTPLIITPSYLSSQAFSFLF